ncbi:MAG: immunoglobulin domain-containing family protein [Schaalia turicensis]
MLPGNWKELNLAEVEVYRQNTAPTAVISAVADPEEGFNVSGDQLNAVPGSILTFTAETSGFPAPTLQWQTSADGQTWNDVEGQTQQGYSFEIDAKHHGLKVRVAATNSVETAYSEPFTINIVEKPALTPLSASLNDSVLEPADDGAWQKVTVNEGETVVLSTTASGMPVPTIAWQSREVSGDEDSWTPIEGATTDKLSLTASKDVQSHLYRAVATNSQGEAVTAPLRVVLHQQAPTPNPGGDPTPNPGGDEPGQADVPTLELGAAQVKVGDTLSIRVKGLKKDERIKLTVHSEPVVIPESDIKYDYEKGTAQADWKVPADFEVGEHTVQIVSAAGERVIKFEVLPADAVPVPDHVVPVPDQSNADKPVADSQPVKKASVKKLSSTGSDAVLLAELSALFLATGVAGFAARRRVRD